MGIIHIISLLQDTTAISKMIKHWTQLINVINNYFVVILPFIAIQNMFILYSSSSMFLFNVTVQHNILYN